MYENLVVRVYHYVRLCYHIISIKFVTATMKVALIIKAMMDVIDYL